jgi:hypothetical protein
MTIEQILDELDQRPNQIYWIDRYLFPLFGLLLREHGFEFDVIEMAQEACQCRIKRQSTSYSESSAK